MINSTRPGEDAKMRNMVKESKEEHLKNGRVKVQNRLLDRQLELLEKDRAKMAKLHAKRKVELSFELAERRKDSAFINLITPRIKPRPLAPVASTDCRQLSLPLDVLPLGVEAVEDWTAPNERPGPKTTLSRNDKVASGPEARFDLATTVGAAESCEPISDGTSRRNSHSRIPEYELTPEEVKYRYNKRCCSVNFLDNGIATSLKEAREPRPPTARSVTSLRKDSLPPAGARLVSRRICTPAERPSNDRRFSNLISALSQRFDDASIVSSTHAGRRRVSEADSSATSATSSDKKLKHFCSSDNVLKNNDQRMSIF